MAKPKTTWLCVACSTDKEPAFVDVKRCKDGTYCRDCGSFEVVANVKTLQEAMGIPAVDVDKCPQCGAEQTNGPGFCKDKDCYDKFLTRCQQ